MLAQLGLYTAATNFILCVNYRVPGLCVYYCSTYYKVVRVGGGGGQGEREKFSYNHEKIRTFNGKTWERGIGFWGAVNWPNYAIPGGQAVRVMPSTIPLPHANSFVIGTAVLRTHPLH